MIGIRHVRALAFACAAVGLTGFSSPQGTAPAQTLTINDVNCLSNGASWTGEGSGTCSSSVSGGTGVYTYSWEPQPERDYGSWARIPCILGSNRNVWLTVTDSNGATAFFATSFFCGEAA